MVYSVKSLLFLNFQILNKWWISNVIGPCLASRLPRFYHRINILPQNSQRMFLDNIPHENCQKLISDKFPPQNSQRILLDIIPPENCQKLVLEITPLQNSQRILLDNIPPENCQKLILDNIPLQNSQLLLDNILLWNILHRYSFRIYCGILSKSILLEILWWNIVQKPLTPSSVRKNICPINPCKWTPQNLSEKSRSAVYTILFFPSLFT